MILKQVVLLAVIYTASAHLCLLSPPQRGSISGLNKPGKFTNKCIKLSCVHNFYGNQPVPVVIHVCL